MKLSPLEQEAVESFTHILRAELPQEAIDSLDVEVPFMEWVDGIVLDGKPFSFDRHEYLLEPYQDEHPHQVELKATQLGLTTKALLKALYGAKWGGYKGVLYMFPSKTDVSDFSRSRISPLIEENPDISGWIKDTDSVNLKKIGDAFLYLRGMKSRVGLKSIPVDFEVFDELDEAPPLAEDMAMERMAHSEFKHVLKLSNPTLPDYGIDKAFQGTDQRHWLLKCEKCGGYTNLVETFPDCLQQRGDRVIRACRKCGGELNPSIGEWVAKYPGADKRGRQYSQLFSHYVEPADILHQFRTTNNLTDFYNLKIGIAYVEAHNRLTVQQILDLCDTEMLSGSKDPCYMGVDQGKYLHVVIGQPKRVVHLNVYRDWEELDSLMRNFNVVRCVVDALPETRNARAFAKRFPGKVFLNYYNVHQKGSYSWNEGELIVQCNRTESLDSSHNEIQNGEIALPKECEVVREFANHLHNVAKKLEEDEETGSKRYVYVKLGTDHFRHAFNYEVMAQSEKKYLDDVSFQDYPVESTLEDGLQGTIDGKAIV